MKTASSLLLTLGGSLALAIMGDSVGAFTYSAAASHQPPPPAGHGGAEDPPDLSEDASVENTVLARAHTTICRNTLDCSISSVSACADGWGPTWEHASYAALLSLSQYTCLGAICGCCEYVVDQNFGDCGRPG